MDEIWKNIEGFEGIYQVSNLGRIKSLDRVDSLGHHRSERILKSGTDEDGYQLARLFKNGKAKMFKVHRLVYAAFCGEIPDGMQVNHINEDKSDNRLENLNLMTPKENCNWGTHIEKIIKALSKPVVGYDEQGNVVVTFSSTQEAGRNGYCSGNISACCNGKKHFKTCRGLTWKYLNQ